MAVNVSDELFDEVPLTVFVDKERKKVVYAEAGKDFVDVLLSFLTLPLGTIARLLAKESNIVAVRFGSISSLYQSVTNLDGQYLWSNTCKEMLLKPRNSMGAFCQMMKLNIDNTEPLQCNYTEDNTCKIENRYCVSTLKDQNCFCGKLLNQESFLNMSMETGFVKETSTFIVSDDLYVMPNEVRNSSNLLQKHGVNDIDAIDRQTFHISKKEVIDILKLSLFSKTPLTNFIFKKEQFLGNLDPRNRLEFWIVEGDEQSDEMVVKVLRRKSNEQILFVEAKEDFADFVFSFLTFPLGGVLRMLHGVSFLYCIDNLYKSMTELSSDKCLRSQGLKGLLTNPPVSMQFELKNQILSGMENNYRIKIKSYNFVDPKSPISGGYTRGPLTFMVTDDLVVTPMSSSNVVSYLERMKVPLNDVEERLVNIGRKEGLSILKASLTTTSALTNGLSLYIMEQFMNEQRSHSIHKREKFAITATN